MTSPSGAFAAKLQFSDGTKMRIFGAHLGILSSLEHDLEHRKKNAEQGVALTPDPPPVPAVMTATTSTPCSTLAPDQA